MTIVLLSNRADETARWHIKVPVPADQCTLLGVKTITRKITGCQRDAEALERQLRDDLQHGRMRRRSAQRLPFGPLERAVETTNLTVLADRLGVKRHCLYKYRERGVSLRLADQLAAAAGLHPGDVWHDWWDLQELVEVEPTGTWITERFRELEDRVGELTDRLARLEGAS